MLITLFSGTVATLTKSMLKIHEYSTRESINRFCNVSTNLVKFERVAEHFL